MKWRSLEESTQKVETRSLRKVFTERKELIAKYVPVEIQSIHARVVDELTASGITERALKSGDSAPDFELQDQSGTIVRSSELLQTGPLVICFFRGRWCPFCVGQMEAMNAIVPHLRDLCVSLIGISPQTVHQSYLMADQHKLGFPLFSDAGNKVAKQFGIVYRVPEYQQEVYSRAFVNLPFVNGDATWELPVPATFIVAKSNHRGHAVTQRNTSPSNTSIGDELSTSVIVYASADPDYTIRPEPTDILDFLAQLSS